MKDASNIITAFVLSIAQFLIGVAIVNGKADIHTIGVYYIVASCFTVFIAILAAMAKVIQSEGRK